MTLLLYFTTILFAILLILFVKKNSGPTSPASFFTYYWCVQILIMVILWSDFLYFNYHGLIYILLCLFVYDIGYTSIGGGIYNNKNTVSYKHNSCMHIYLFVLFLAFFSAFYGISSSGFSLSNLFDLSSFLEMSNQNSVDRYSGDAEQGGVIEKLLGINSYTCPFIGGVLFHYFQKEKKWMSYIAILPMVIGGLAQGVKMGIITGTFLWFIGLILSSKLLSIKIHIDFKRILVLVIVAIGFVGLLAITMMFRIGQFDIDALYIVAGKTVSYALGHLPAFDMWFNQTDISLADLTFGGKTFFGITNTLGIMKREAGIFTTMYTISRDGDMTNVFTIFRFFLEDFGYIGTLIFLFFVGRLSKVLYCIFLSKKNIYRNTSIMCALYFFISWSMVASIFAYATYICMFFYIAFILRYVFKYGHSNHREVKQ